MLIEKIRAQSALFHSDLDSSALLQPLASGSVSQQHYLLVLQKFHAFFSALEKSTVSINNYLPDFSLRRKAEFLENDINFFGHEVLTNCNVEIPQVNNEAYAFGCMYVMEGSTLGGKFIFKNIQSQLNITSERGGKFFHGYGKETGTMWKVFIESLLRFYDEDKRESAILEGVQDTFVLLKKWLDK